MFVYSLDLYAPKYVDIEFWDKFQPPLCSKEIFQAT